MSPVVEIERGGSGSALVRLNRPEKRNALSLELRWELARVFADLQADPGVTAIGLTGAGSAFCSGMDVTQFGGDAEHRRALVESSIACFRAVAECVKPTAALINGPAIAGGFALALLCDIRVAHPSARMGFPEIGRYIPPPYAAAAWALPAAVARDLCLTGRLIGAEEALALGVVSRVEGGMAALEQIAGAPAPATAEVKRRILLHRAGASFAELAADEERALHAALLGTHRSD
jgi:enoyl-CoA hydratase/carnithine racemase